MNTRLHAVQHIRRMRGGSQAHLLRASDGAYYVTKFQNNPQQIRVLANEMFATRLAQWLGLPVPGVEIIEVSDWLIANTADLRVEAAGSVTHCSSGRQVALRYPEPGAPVFDYLPESLLSQVINLKDFARCLVLDKGTANTDGRQAIFTRNPRGRRYRAMFIDQGYCFNAGEWTFPDNALQGAYATNCVYGNVTGWEAFEPALTRVEEAKSTAIWRCAEAIPREWYGEDHDALHALVETLCQRRRIIRNLISAFRQSSRHPFPNWTDTAPPALILQAFASECPKPELSGSQ
jgi:HipA-like kinase